MMIHVDQAKARSVVRMRHCLYSQQKERSPQRPGVPRFSVTWGGGLDRAGLDW